MLPMQMRHPGSRAAPMDERLHGEETEAREVAAVAVDACLVAAALVGASLLTWWSVAFHPTNTMLWMVPVGLVLACTPAVVCLALSFVSTESQVPGGGGGGGKGSDVVLWIGGKGSDAGAEAPPLSAVVVEK